MTELTPELEAMVEPMAWKLCPFRRPTCECEIAKTRGACDREKEQARFMISLGARIEVPKSPGQLSYEKAVELGMVGRIGSPIPWKDLPAYSQSLWEQIAAAARGEE